FHVTGVQTCALPIYWEQAYLDLIDYKARKGWSNLVIRPETLRVILEKVPYTLTASEAVFCPRTFTDRARLQEAVTAILRKYLDRSEERRVGKGGRVW